MPVESGTSMETGSFRCEDCGYGVSLNAQDTLPRCPSCGSTRFGRASLFSDPEATQPAHAAAEAPGWVPEARERVEAPGPHLAYDDDGMLVVLPLADGWTRIGRSLMADLRFDDPTVSRRHALIECTPAGVRVLDDRSLNGVFVNGERVEAAALRDGDEVLVGRHQLVLLVGARAGADAADSALAAG